MRPAPASIGMFPFETPRRSRHRLLIFRSAGMYPARLFLSPTVASCGSAAAGKTHLVNRFVYPSGVPAVVLPCAASSCVSVTVTLTPSARNRSRRRACRRLANILSRSVLSIFITVTVTIEKEKRPGVRPCGYFRISKVRAAPMAAPTMEQTAVMITTRLTMVLALLCWSDCQRVRKSDALCFPPSSLPVCLSGCR